MAHMPLASMIDRADLDHSMLEGCRLRSMVALYRDVSTDQTLTDFNPCVFDPSDPSGVNPISNPDPEGSTKTLNLPAGTRVLCDLTTASRDAASAPNPSECDPERPFDVYMHYSWGPHKCLGLDVANVLLTAIFKTVVGLPGLRRVDGPRGMLKSVPASIWEGQVGRGEAAEWTGIRMYMTPDQSSFWPVPTTMRVRWDE